MPGEGTQEAGDVRKFEEAGNHALTSNEVVISLFAHVVYILATRG